MGESGLFVRRVVLYVVLSHFRLSNFLRLSMGYPAMASLEVFRSFSPKARARLERKQLLAPGESHIKVTGVIFLLKWLKFVVLCDFKIGC